MENGTTHKTSLYLPAGLYVVLRNRAQNKGVSVQDVVREALTTAMKLEDRGFLEKLDQIETRLAAEQAAMRAKIDALVSERACKLDAPAASEPAKSEIA